MSNNSTYENIPVITPSQFPPQHQPLQPGSQGAMNPIPITDNPLYHGSGKLEGRVAIVTGGDSGIGQAVAVAFAKEGADIVVPFYSEQEDAGETVRLVSATGRRCVTVICDLKQESSARQVVDTALHDFGHISILVNNIAVQFPQNSISDITVEQLNNTFATNIISYFYMTKAVLPHLRQGASIINTTSVTAYKGQPTLIDYSASKGAVVSFTRSMALSLASNGIRVNAVAPGPVWTPLIPSSFSEEDVAKFGKNVPLGRAAQPFELAPTYVYLASDDSAFVTGQVLHVNGGIITDS
ncbi:glucose 1-dehydrogenase [Acetanaerobacterium elongatum]|uniref:NAD(P)-dependent dehydrogenase, short-chain alcohol dehydrogenase family n=1 Tax=Acetanaerobacterium elongatum TaxID=258515 RepID=A0A1H0CQT8_9FIRM|nr:glucose 1-dehydrogenase [Acetanaerobacterium elongatum]SDN60208.1 NAD(P)-dependent dehydrogenase, short-chain alcohol dehydrogenase family [Acetanaerobacterium elongatum]